MFKAQVEENSTLAPVRPDAERDGNAGNNLQATTKIVRLTNAGIDKQRVVARLLFIAGYRFGTVPCRF